MYNGKTTRKPDTSRMTTRYVEKRKEHGREKKGIPMLSSVLCAAVVLPKAEQSCFLQDSLPPPLCFPLPLPLLVFCSPSCPYSLHLSWFSTHHFQLCDPAFSLSAVSPPPFLFPSLSSLFPSSFTFSACLSVLPYVYLSHSLTLFSTASIFPVPLSIISPSLSLSRLSLPYRCIIQMRIFHFFFLPSPPCEFYRRPQEKRMGSPMLPFILIHCRTSE